MSYLKIHFVRHVPVMPEPKDRIYGAYVKMDIGCTDLFKKAAKVLPNPKNSYWVSSPFMRSLATSEGVQVAMGCDDPVDIIDDFQERNFGKFTGRRFVNIRRDPAFQAFLKDQFNAPVPEGETGVEFHQRVNGAITSLLNVMKKNNQQEAVVFCHGGVIKYAHYYNKDLPSNQKELQHKVVDYVSVHPMTFKVD